MRLRHLLVVAALGAMAAACASSGAVPRPFPTPDREPPVTHPEVSLDADTIVGTALSLRGIPYRNGGSDPHGFDCSGFVQYVFARHGLRLPREVRDQWQMGRTVRGDRLSAGDLLFFATNGSGVSHVGIAIGADEFVHAPSSKGVVRVERVTAQYWAQRYLGARRVTN